MKTAKYIKRFTGSRGDAAVYELSEPIADFGGTKKSSHVVVSAVSVMGEPETYIFPCDADGNITSWGELPGSFKGGLDHAEALRGAGYEVVS
jgi:hypothetical protein